MATAQLKPIETKYKGYRFRSRLEARWAVFFDLLGLQWEYEPEGFVLPSGQPYLPDFRVYTPQGQHIWYEVKPESVKEYGKFSEFIEQIKNTDDAWHGLGWSYRATILSGDPMGMVLMDRPAAYGKYITNICPRCGLIDGPTHDNDGDGCRGGSQSLSHFGCQPCDGETPQGKGNHPSERGVLGVEVNPYKGYLYMDDLNCVRFARLVLNAVQSARSARFEHGECG